AGSSYNTAVGAFALAGTSCYHNIALGDSAGYLLTNGDANIVIGSVGVAGDANTIRIGNSTDHTRAFIAGIRNASTGMQNAIAVVIDSNGQLGTVSSSRRFKFDINDMSSTTDGLMQLRPVTFRYLAHRENAALQYGLIAEEVEAVYPELVTRDAEGRPDSVMYQFLAPMLLNEVQKQHRQIEE